MVLAASLAGMLAIGFWFLHSGSGTQPPPSVAASTSPGLAPDRPPRIEPLANAGALELDVPVTQARITAIVYHGVGNANVIPLQPVGHQINASFLARLGNRLFGRSSDTPPGYYVDDSAEGPDTGSVDVGAAAGTTIYAPATGVVVAVRPFVLNGKQWGDVVQIRPDDAPAVTVSMTNLERDPDVDVGTRVTAGRTPVGKIADLSAVLQQTLARYTSDAGNHVAISIGPAPGTSPLL